MAEIEKDDYERLLEMCIRDSRDADDDGAYLRHGRVGRAKGYLRRVVRQNVQANECRQGYEQHLHANAQLRHGGAVALVAVFREKS